MPQQTAINKQQLLSAIKKVSEAMKTLKNSSMNEQYPIGLIDIDLWEWPQGVGLYGMYQYFEATADPDVLQYLISWYDRRIAAGLPERNVNTCSPLITLVSLAEKTDNPEYRHICKEWSEWVMNGLIRTGEDRAFQHMITGDANEGQILIDTLFMTVMFLAKAGIYFEKPGYVEEAKRQYLLHIKYLYNKKSGLFYHGWDYNGKHNYGAVHWGRGNAWYTCGAVDFLDTAAMEPGLKEYLLDTLRCQVLALVELQHESGLWHTVLDDPSSYLEASASAAIGYGILKGVRLGYLPAELKNNGMLALQGVLAQINEDGVVQQVSYGTPVGYDAQFYKDIPISPMTYGQSMTQLLLIEALKHVDEQQNTYR
ncbi:beta-galactosidase BglB [Paenibacillus sp. IITD108]|uniref:beta-galactosidase BglB n=1 Tax=Paenibacillus sp. IITD108 TaxID=3116649 RepID=UPI002F4118BD